MAIVKQYTSKTGATIIIDDGAYRNKTPEQLQMIRENIKRVAIQCLIQEAKAGTLIVKA